MVFTYFALVASSDVKADNSIPQQQWAIVEVDYTLDRILTILSHISTTGEIRNCYSNSCEGYYSFSRKKRKKGRAYFMKSSDLISEHLIEGSFTIQFTHLPKNESTLLNVKIDLQKFQSMEKKERLIYVFRRFSIAVAKKYNLLDGRDYYQGIPFKRLMDLQQHLLINGASLYSLWNDKYRTDSSNNVFFSIEKISYNLTESEEKRFLLDTIYYNEYKVTYFPHNFDKIGFHISHRNTFTEADIAAQTSFKSSLIGYTNQLGVNYRFKLFPKSIKNFRSSEWNYLRSIFVDLNTNIGYGTLSHKISDEQTSIEGSSSFMKYGLDFRLYFPIYANFWVHTGLGIQYQEFKINETNANLKAGHPGFNIGASYAIPY